MTTLATKLLQELTVFLRLCVFSLVYVLYLLIYIYIYLFIYLFCLFIYLFIYSLYFCFGSDVTENEPKDAIHEVADPDLDSEGDNLKENEITSFRNSLFS